MGNSAPKIPRYSPQRFVGRTDEIAWIQSQVQKVLDGQDPEARVLEFWGPRGSGKSWLLQHLAQERCPQPGLTGKQLAFDSRVCSLYLDLDHFYRRSRVPGVAIQNLVLTVGQQVSAWSGQPATGAGLPKASLTDQCDWLEADVRQLATWKVLVLLLDHVSEQPAAFLEPLESHVLAPLARTGGVLLVVSKRGKGYPWQEGVLRWHACDYDLGFFDVDSTRQQLERWGLDSGQAYEVWQQSRGCPLTNYFIPRTDGVRKAAEALLAGVLPPDRDRVEALCVLRFVREEHLPRMLAACKADPALCVQQDAETKAQIQRLVDLGFLRWDRYVDGFVLDPAIQPLVERWLFLSSRERWRRLQCEAYVLYIDWLARDPYSARLWINEAAYHGEQLEREGYQLYDCFPSCCYQPPSPAAEPPGGDVEPPPGPWNEGLFRLRDLLAELYDTEHLSRQVVARANVRSARIAFSSAAQTNWFNILNEAVRQHRVGDLVRVAREDFPEQAEVLSQAERQFYSQMAVPAHPSRPAVWMTRARQDRETVERMVAATQPNLEAIRGLLQDVFGRGELRKFCRDLPRFQPICQELKPKMNRDRQIRVVIRYCQEHRLLSELLSAIRRLNPEQYEQHVLYSTDQLPEGFAEG